MDTSEALEKIGGFAKSPNGKVFLLVAGGALLLFFYSRSRSSMALAPDLPQGSIPAAQPGTADPNATAPQTDPATAALNAQVAAARELGQIQIDQQKQQFDMVYGGNDVSFLDYAGIVGFRSGMALGDTKSPRTAPAPLDGAGLVGGVPSKAGQSVLEAIGSALGLGVSQGESRASVMARITAWQNEQAVKNQKELTAASTNAQMELVRQQAAIASEQSAQQFQQQAAIQQQQIKAQERANNPFSSLGNFFKTAAAVVTGSKSRSVDINPTGQTNPATAPVLEVPYSYAQAVVSPAFTPIQQTAPQWVQL